MQFDSTNDSLFFRTSSTRSAVEDRGGLYEGQVAQSDQFWPPAVTVKECPLYSDIDRDKHNPDRTKGRALCNAIFKASNGSA